MPRKTKDINKISNNKNTETTNKKSTSTKTVNNSTSKAKKETTKKASVSSKRSVKTTNKSNANKKATSTSKSTRSKSSSKTTKTTEKSATKKTRKTTAKKGTKNSIVKPVIVEYYDLPYRYNQTIVKVLAQTPNNLFIYWDISDEDRKNLEELYGENFFEKTKPVLVVHNETLNYTFEVDINDFANSWYLQVNDSKCDYKIELGRRPIVDLKEFKTTVPNNYIYISSSNDIIAPNDKVLFNINPETIQFRNVKTNNTQTKSITKLTFMPHLQQVSKIYNIYNLYKELYKDENLEDIFNPSSGNSSSKFI